MQDDRKPQRMGLTRKLAVLESPALQEKALMADECIVVFSFSEIDQVQHGFISGDILVALDAAVFKGVDTVAKHVVLDAGPKVKKRPGPKPRLKDASPDQWSAMRYFFTHPQVKQQTVVDYAHWLGFDKVDRHAISNRIKAEMLDAAIGNEGEEV